MTMTSTLDQRFSRVRDELEIPAEFPRDVLDAGRRAASRTNIPESERHARADFTIVPFVTIDPEGSRDLDQALYIQRHEAGWFVLYAIADVGYFVEPKGAIETEAWKRGVTLYGPDVRTPLYPPELSSGAASLLPNAERPCILFSFDIGISGEDRLLSIQPAIVRSRAALSYDAVSRHLRAEDTAPGAGEFAGCDGAETLAELRAVGRLRQQLEINRGGVSLPIAAQHVERWALALSGYQLTLKNPNDVEGWNAQISLMTGMAAAKLMVARGVGLLRVLDEPREDRMSAFRLAAQAVGVAWPDEMPYADFVRSLDPADGVHAALLVNASGVMGGARYVAFDGTVPAGCRHAAIASHYSHVTAPLRRLADRYVLDTLVRLAADEPVPRSAAGTFEELVDVMGKADRRDRQYENRIVDLTEAAAMEPRVGDTFDAVVLRLRDGRVSVQIADPPIRVDLAIEESFGVTGQLEESATRMLIGRRAVALGDSLRLILDRVDLDAGRLRFQAQPPLT